MKETTTKQKVDAFIRSALANSQEAKEMGVLVRLLNEDKYIKKDRILEIITGYVGKVDQVLTQLVRGFLLATVNDEAQQGLLKSQSIVIDALDKSIAEFNHLIETSQIKPLGQNYTPEQWRTYIEVLEKHEKEIDELFATFTQQSS